MCLLVESIRVMNGVLENLEFHNRRANTARKKLFDCVDYLDLSDFIIIPDEYCSGLVKCRVTYKSEVMDIGFDFYKKRKINTLQCVEDNSIEYAYKYQDRRCIDRLLVQNTNADDILIIKDGYVTDVSFGNIIFYDGEHWFTPQTFLLPGTKRQKLLNEKIICERKIKHEDIHGFEKGSIINAMLDPGDIEIDICNIYSLVNE